MFRTILAALTVAAVPVLAVAQDTAVDGAAQDPVEDADGAQVGGASGTFLLELNNAATLEENVCQLTYVATNDSGDDLAQASFQVGFFDGAGIVRRILVLDFGALPPGKTRIVPFNLPDQSCEDLSRIVVNDVAHCALADGGTSAVCGGALVATSRTDIQFGL